MFAYSLGWIDDLTLEKSFAAGNRRRGTIQLACYALHLASGHTLLSRALRCTTIKQYIRDVASLLALFGPVEFDDEAS